MGGLYALAVVIESVVGLLRAALFTFVLWLMFLFGMLLVVYLDYLAIGNESVFAYQNQLQVFSENGLIWWPVTLGGLLAYSNILTSLMAYIGFGGGSLMTRFVMGAREASTREQEKLNELFTQMVSQSEIEIRSFSKLYILDSLLESVNLIGTTLYVSSGAIRGNHLPALIAHEYGHLNYGDGSNILALRRLVFPLFSLFISGIRDFSTGRPIYRPEIKAFDPVQLSSAIKNKLMFFRFALIGGGISVWALSWFWAKYFRENDYLADAFAVKLGYKDELLAYLEQDRFYDTAVPYMLAWYPANELRIDAIENPGYRVARIASGGGDMSYESKVMGGFGLFLLALAFTPVLRTVLASVFGFTFLFAWPCSGLLVLIQFVIFYSQFIRIGNNPEKRKQFLDGWSAFVKGVEGIVRPPWDRLVTFVREDSAAFKEWYNKLNVADRFANLKVRVREFPTVMLGRIERRFGLERKLNRYDGILVGLVIGLLVDSIFFVNSLVRLLT